MRSHIVVKAASAAWSSRPSPQSRTAKPCPRIDTWGRKHDLTRSEALRALVEQALDHDK